MAYYVGTDMTLKTHLIFYLLDISRVDYITPNYKTRNYSTINSDAVGGGKASIQMSTLARKK